jgi:hypothetical protein
LPRNGNAGHWSEKYALYHAVQLCADTTFIDFGRESHKLAMVGLTYGEPITANQLDDAEKEVEKRAQAVVDKKVEVQLAKKAERVRIAQERLANKKKRKLK